MEAYWQDPVATREVMVDGWVATGDAGYLDSDGFLWLSGRIKHIIICDGDNIHPGEVEREIAKHPRVKRVSVFGIRHETRGETVAAAVILRKGEDEFTLSDLQGFLDDRLSEVKVPKSLLILDRFPETVGDKLDREAMAGALRERLMSSGDGLRGEE
jgi:acyl-CoA synthetase (AMP-forming)/AMP-acid ligase II